MKRITRFRGSLILLVVYLLALSYFMISTAPGTRIPMHWNIRGEIDGWAGKTEAGLFGAGLCLFLFLMIYLMPYYSPKYRNQEARFEKLLPSLSFVLILFFALISLYSFALASWEGIIPMNFIMVILGLLMICLGNILPKAPRNFFIGIRTPWTLSDDDIWQRTHRLGGYTFVISGIILGLQGFFLMGSSALTRVSSVVAFGLLMLPLVYSFVLFRQKANLR